MTNETFGSTLVEARKARGLTLRDVERDTRISTRYLEALEAGHLEVLPAPVYARAFARTYAQYLGLDAAKIVQQLPGAKPEADLPPLPDVRREATVPLVSASWMIAGVVIVLLLVVGLVMFWSRGGDGETQVVVPDPIEENGGQGAEQPTIPTVSEPDPTGGPLVIEDGVVPDLVGEHLVVAVTALREEGIQYVVIELESEQASEGIIFNQSPPAGTEIGDSTVVTITASR